MIRFVNTLSIVISGLLLAGAGVAQSTSAATNGLVASYGFNEATGSVLHDLSGNGNNGAIAGASWVRGKYGGALRFNGSSSRVTVPGSSSLSPTGAVTVEAWIRPQLAGSWRTVAMKEQNSTSLSYGLYGASPKGASANVYTGSSELDAAGAHALPVSAWSHVAAVYDGTMIRLYTNGSLTAQQFAPGSVVESSGAFRIGGNAIWGEWFSGTIDELRVYNRALTASEIQTDMATRVSASANTIGADTLAPTAPTGLVSNSVTQTSAVLSWSASTDNVGVSGYGTYRNGVVAGSTSATTYTVSGLTCGTTYSLSVDAFDAAGNRSAKTAATVVTAACAGDTQAPTIPANVARTAATTTSINVSWTASTDNVGVTGYGLYRNGTSVGTATSTSSAFTGLVCGTSYTLGVDAFDAAGNRSARGSVTASTAACSDTTPPSVPVGLGTSAAQTSVTLSWSASSDNVGVTGYGLYRNGVSTGTTASTSATFSGLTCATSYTLAVDAFDAAGNRSAKASVSASTAACGGGGGGSCPKGSVFADGCSGAPAGAPQYPNMLSGYAVRPAWNVAGVDYHVGIPSGTSLTPWRSVSIPNVSISLSSGQITCSGASGTTVTLDGIDFSPASGIAPYIYGYTSNCHWIIKNSKFGCADNGVANILSDDAVIVNNEFDQNGCSNLSTIIQGAVVTIEYNWFKHSVQHILESGGPGAAIDYEFNLIDDSVPGGAATGQHENFQQLTGTATINTDLVRFNTNYQHSAGSGNGEGFQFYCNSGPCRVNNPALSNNTLICLGGTNMSNFINAGDPPHPADIINGTNSNNYFDTTGCNAYKSNSIWTPWASIGNINMLTGAPILP